MNKYAPEIIQLRLDIEEKIGIHPSTPTDFESMVSRIWQQMHANIALSTLERLWGYVSGADNTRRSTLNLLAQFLQYRDWDDYLKQLNARTQGGSYAFIAAGVYVKNLRFGQMVEVTWLPNRRCVFRYLGYMQFEVVESHNSKLQVGDTFFSTFLLKGHPMYVDNLVQAGKEPVTYIAGNDGGLQSVRIL